MVAETLSSPTPQIDNITATGVQAGHSAEKRATVKKSAGINPAERTEGRQQRLVVHLLIGFLMAIIAIAGYLFLGPHTHTKAADNAGNYIVNVATNIPPQTADGSAIDDQNQINDMAVMQAEMAEITRQMSALKAQSLPSNVTGSTIYNSNSGYSQDQVSTRLDLMMSLMNNILIQRNGLNTQTSGMSAPVNGTGPGHH